MDTLAELQHQYYCNDKNYHIHYTDTKVSCVAVYFTSNNLFFPHDLDSFRLAVINKDRFEWTNIMIGRAQKHIFIRDIYKQWYASGINVEINSMEKLVEWLRNETKNYKEIIMVGSSGGGYAATIAGIKLKASIIYNFNGQWNLYDNVERDGHIISPILKEMIDKNDIGVKYFDITNFGYDSSNIFYFVSKLSTWDKKQYSFIKKFKNINIISFCNNHHGIPFLKSTLPTILAMNHEELKKLTKHQHIPFIFDCRIAGLKNTLLFVIKSIIKKYKNE